jgi:hypothetical protein
MSTIKKQLDFFVVFGKKELRGVLTMRSENIKLEIQLHSSLAASQATKTSSDSSKQKSP